MADKVTKLILKLSLFPESENEDENTKVTKSHQTLRNPSCQVDNKYTQVLDAGTCKIYKDTRYSFGYSSGTFWNFLVQLEITNDALFH